MFAFVYTITASTFIAILGWGLGIEPRIQVLKVKQEDLKELIINKFDDQSKRLDRIERALNGALRRDS